MLSTLIFDLGGVMIDWNPRHLYRKLFDDEAAMERFLKEVTPGSWNHEMDEGKPFAQAVAERIELFPEQAELLRAYHERWEEMLGGAILETVELFDSFRQNPSYQVYALTNWSAETMPIAKRHYAFLDQFEGMVVSGEENVAKPDPRIFHILFERYQIDPKTALFIDDSAPNLATAAKLGLQTIHFRSPMQLREELAKRL